MFMLTMVAATLTPSQAPEPTPARAAIERSLVFLEKEGLAWKNERKCVSCHHVPFMLWNLHEAKARGFAVNGKTIDETTQ